jgi:hypothetical protein
VIVTVVPGGSLLKSTLLADTVVGATAADADGGANAAGEMEYEDVYGADGNGLGPADGERLRPAWVPLPLKGDPLGAPNAGGSQYVCGGVCARSLT